MHSNGNMKVQYSKVLGKIRSNYLNLIPYWNGVDRRDLNNNFKHKLHWTKSGNFLEN